MNVSVIKKWFNRETREKLYIITLPIIKLLLLLIIGSMIFTAIVNMVTANSKGDSSSGYVKGDLSNVPYNENVDYDNEEDFRVERKGNRITIESYKGTKDEVSIPPRIQDLPVTSIGDWAFFYRTSLVSVTIPDSVTSIEECAFLGCTNLTSVTIPNSFTGIEVSAFEGCTNLASITIPDSVTSIELNAFSNCTILTSVTFQGTIPSSGFYDNAFYGLGNLRDKFYETDKTNGTPGTYTRPDGKNETWTRQ
jgi:hypothetical protein